MMDKQKEDGKAFETFNIEMDITYLNKTQGKCTFTKSARARTGVASI